MDATIAFSIFLLGLFTILELIKKETPKCNLPFGVSFYFKFSTIEYRCFESNRYKD